MSTATTIPIPPLPNPMPTYPSGGINYNKINKWAGIVAWEFTTHRMRKGGRSHALDNKYKAELKNGRVVTGAYVSLGHHEWRVTCEDPNDPSTDQLSIECKLRDCPAAHGARLMKAFADLPALSDS